jgi:MFS transporter, PPP family, 3-phenylpropionic acid transporter
MTDAARSSTRLPPVRLAMLFALVYAGFGAQSPFLTTLLSSRGISAETIGFIIAAGGVIRLVEVPLLARWADAARQVRWILAGACALAACAALAYAAPLAGWPLVVVALAQAAALAPVAPFADAIALSAAERARFAYGFVRGVGSGAFVLATLAAGALASAYGWIVTAFSQALLLALAAPFAARAPEPAAQAPTATASWRDLVAIAPFRAIILIAALVLGSHALHDGFAIIYWTRSGISPRVAGFLWSESVAAEVLVFLLLGPRLLAAVGERAALMLALAAAVLRWSVMALTASAAAMMLTEPLHGLSFALLHLACMSVIGRTVPPALAASAQAFYGAIGIGLANIVLAALSGLIFARYGGGAFWFMAALAAAAAPLVLRLKV